MNIECCRDVVEALTPRDDLELWRDLDFEVSTILKLIARPFRDLSLAFNARISSALQRGNDLG